jgi:uncharacterized protein (TIGR02996 family)
MDDPLFDKVLANPDDDALRQVWADTLLERGDPRGELIALQVAAQTRGLDGREKKRVRSLLSINRTEWLAELSAIVQRREGLVFDRGLLDECQIQIKTLDGLKAATGHPLWATVRRVWFTNHFAWDERIVPLLTHPVFARLRDVICVGMYNVFAALATFERPLPFQAIWAVNDGWRARDFRSLSELGEAPGLPALQRLGFQSYGTSNAWILELPVVQRISKLGLTVGEPAAFWLEHAAALPGLETIELRPRWLPNQGRRRSHFVLRFTRGADRRFSRLTIEKVGRCYLTLAQDDLDSLAPDALEQIETSCDDPELNAYLRRFPAWSKGPSAEA